MNRAFPAAAFVLALFSQAAPAEPVFTALPGKLETRNPPVTWTAIASDALTITAGAKTNWFVPPWNAANAVDSAPTLLFHPDGNFTLKAKIALEPKSRWDSGALALFVDKDHWAKLCLENAKDDGRLQVVMVVNAGASDDSYTDFIAPDGALWLSVSRNGSAFYFSASKDGRNWTMFRAFHMEGDLSQLKAGLLAQSPVGDGITVRFSDIHYEVQP